MSKEEQSKEQKELETLVENIIQMVTNTKKVGNQVELLRMYRLVQYVYLSGKQDENSI